MVYISQTAEIDPSAIIGIGTKVWSYAQIRENVEIGPNCTIGRNVYIGPGVKIGANCKIQNNAQIYEPAIIEDGVFVGPSAVLTNDRHPRAINMDGTIKSAKDWTLVGVVAKKGASIGANSVCVAPLVLGEWCAVGANAVVTKDVPEGVLVLGNPAREFGKANF